MNTRKDKFIKFIKLTVQYYLVNLKFELIQLKLRSYNHGDIEDNRWKNLDNYLIAFKQNGYISHVLITKLV